MRAGGGGHVCFGPWWWASGLWCGERGVERFANAEGFPGGSGGGVTGAGGGAMQRGATVCGGV